QAAANTSAQTSTDLTLAANANLFANFTKDATKSSTTTPELVYSGTPTPSFTYTAADGASKARINLTTAITNSASAFSLRYVLGSTASPWYASSAFMPATQPVVSTLVGTGAGVYGSGVDVDSEGNLYVADTIYNRIWKIASNGAATVLAGSGSDTGALMNGIGAEAKFWEPADVAVDPARKIVYVADTGNNLIRKISIEPGVNYGKVTTGARVGGPAGLVLNTNGDLFVSDQKLNRIMKVTPGDALSLLAGGMTVANIVGFGTYQDGTGGAAGFNKPAGLAIDAAGNVYVADFMNHCIRKIVTEPGVNYGNVTRLASGFNYPSAVAVDANGDIIVTDQLNHRIKKVSTASATYGTVTTIAGNGTNSNGDGAGTGASFSSPNGVAIDTDGNIYVSSGGTIRKISPAVPAGATLSTNLSFVVNNNDKFAIQVWAPSTTASSWGGRMLLENVPESFYGATGAQGATGSTGTAGVKGDTGSQGTPGIGLPGQVGATGDTGRQGDTGATGNAGVTGATGTAGQAGSTGATGTQGATGATGAQGRLGPSLHIQTFNVPAQAAANTSAQTSTDLTLAANANLFANFTKDATK
ncbi:MAG: hypothetical protein EBZ77_13635, partial [Chitinophagia bacterium]|nr:hypothetical protein [Chitinophagia bacterium]